MRKVNTVKLPKMSLGDGAGNFSPHAFDDLAFVFAFCDFLFAFPCVLFFGNQMLQIHPISLQFLRLLR